MRNVRILPYKRGSVSATALARELDVFRINLRSSCIHNQAPKRIINWGNSGRNLPPQGLGDQHSFINTPEAVAIAANKLTAFRAMSDYGVRVPTFTTDFHEALDMLEEGKVVVRNTLTGHSGEGIQIAEDADDMSEDAPLYVMYIPKQDEYRVHIMAGEVIDVQRKARNLDVADEDVNWQVRNHSNGFIFMREGVNPPADVIRQAKGAILSTGLDFGAVDVIWNQHREKAYVLEINTACGLEGTTLARYTDALREFLDTGSVRTARTVEYDEIVFEQPRMYEEEFDHVSVEYMRRMREVFMVSAPTSSRMSDVRREQARQALETARVEDEQPVPTQQRQWAVGDEVTISPDSRYYGRNRHNPAGVRGVVSRIYTSGIPFLVDWDDGTSNIYDQEDLIAWQGAVRRAPQVGDRVRIIREGNGVRPQLVGEMGTVRTANPLVVRLDRGVRLGYRLHHIGDLIELIPNPDVQSSTGTVEPVTQEWVVTVDGNICSDDETFSSREEAEMALVSPEFHNLRAMGRHVAVQQL